MKSTLETPSLGARQRNHQGSLSQQLVDMLADRVKQGELKPGERFPTEVELIEQYGVSRTVVREAVATLKADGLVETRHGIGTFVLDPSQHVKVATDPREVQTIKGVLQLLEFRLNMEAEAAALAARRRSTDDVRAIRAALDEVTRCLRSGEDSTAADFAFHQCIARATGNPFYITTMAHLGTSAIPRAQVRTHQYQALSRQKYMETINRQHEDIFAAIRDEQPDNAWEAMRAHLTGSLAHLRQAIAESEAV